MVKETITTIVPQITLISVGIGIIIFLVLFPVISFIWTNITAIGQIGLFILGVWVASKFLQGRR